MTVRLAQPAINLRDELTALRNKQGYQEQKFYFDGLVKNGTFDSDTIWTKGTGWTISGGVANAAGGTSDGKYLSQSIGLRAGSPYRYSFLVGGTLGGTNYLTLRIGGTTDDFNIITAGTTTGLITATGSGDLRIRSEASASLITLDNVSIFETDGTDVIHTMPHGWHPKSVYENGLLLREGAAHDYTVHTDGLKTWIKPSVAPGALTETCIVGVRA